MAQGSNFIVRGGADFSKLNKVFKQTQEKVKSFESSINKSMAKTQASISKIQSPMKGLSKVFGAVIGGITTVSIARAIKSVTQMAMTVESSMDNIRRNMGNATESYQEFVNTQAKALGMARKDAYEYGSTFSNLLGSFLADTQKVSSETQNLMKSAAVIANKTGRTYEDVADRIRSGLLGFTEAIDDLGIYTNISMIETTDAFKKFANGKTWNQLDYRTQQQIRLAAILEQAYKRYGDTLADTTQTKQAMFLASLENIKLNIGQAFLPIYNAVLPALTALANKLEEITSHFAAFTEALFGKPKVATSTQAIEQQTQAITEQGDAIDNVGKKAKRSLAGFDQLNLLTQTENSGGTGSSSTSTSSNELAEEVTDSAEGVDKLTTALDSAKAKLAEMARMFGLGFSIGFGDSNLDNITNSLNNVKNSLQGIAGSSQLLSAMDGWANKISKSFGMVSGSVTSVGATVAEFFIGSFDKYLVQNSDFLKGKIASLFDISGKRAEIWGNISTAIADIFTVFRSDKAKQIGADLIAIFANSGLSIIELGWQFGTDFLGNISKSIINNKDAIKNALDNTLTPISTLISGLKNFFNEAFESVKRSYDGYVQPALDKFGDGLSKIWNGALDGYNSYLAPTIDKISSKFTELVEKYLSPVIDKATEFFGSLIHETSKLWDFLSPFIGWLAKSVFLSISIHINLLWNTFELAFKQITNTISTFIDVCKGLLDFIVGVFTGDWDRAWDGLKQIFSAHVNNIKNTISNFKDYFVDQFKTALGEVEKLTGIRFEAIKSGFENGWNKVKGVFANAPGWFKEKFDSAFNAVKDAFSPFDGFFSGLGESLGKTFKGALNGVITHFNKFINWVNSKLKFSWDGLKIAGQTIFEGGTVQLAKIPAIPQLARGGIVDSPTLAMIGEAGKEAVVPLENTGFVTTIASAIANEIRKVIDESRSSNGSSNGDVVVRVGEDDFARIAIKAITNANRRAGGTLLEGVL